MAVTIGHLKRGTRTTEATYRGEKIKITYKPGAITPAFGKTLDTLDADKSQLVEFLLVVLVSWDIQDDSKPPISDGVFPPLAITEEVLNQTPTPVLAALQMAIQDDLRVDSKKS